MTEPRRGRPVKRPMPEPIPDTPENIAKAVLATPPKAADEWRYLQDDPGRPAVWLLTSIIPKPSLHCLAVLVDAARHGQREGQSWPRLRGPLLGAAWCVG